MIGDAVPPGAITALIAEDHAGYRARVVAALEARGIVCAAFADGHDAIAWLTAGGAARLLVTDLEMPLRDGWAVIDAWLASGRPAGAIIMVTGEADRRDVRERCSGLRVRLLHKIAFDAQFADALTATLAALAGDGSSRSGEG